MLRYDINKLSDSLKSRIAKDLRHALSQLKGSSLDADNTSALPNNFDSIFERKIDKEEFKQAMNTKSSVKDMLFLENSVGNIHKQLEQLSHMVKESVVMII